MAPGPKRRRATSSTAGHGAAAASSSSHSRGDPLSPTGNFSPLARSLVGKKRRQMRVFLADLLDGGRVDGLYWTDKGRMIFRMPWKHAKKKDYNPSKDAELIKLWAINTGRYGREGQDPDATNWKINFRCALNSLKESIVEEENNEEDDYRVYRFNDSKRGRLKSRPTGPVAFVQDVRPSSPASSYASSSSSGSSEPDSPLSTEEVMDDSFALAIPTTLTTHTGIPGYISTHAGSCSMQGAWAPDSHQISDEGFQQMLANLSNICDDSEVSDVLMESMLSQDVAAPQQAESGARPVVLKTTSGGKTMPPGSPRVEAESGNDSGVENDKGEKLPDCHEIYIKVCYRGSPVAGMKVDRRPGCRVFFGPCPPIRGLALEEQERLFGSRHLMQLSLPTPGQAQSVLPSIWYLLDSLQRGIILEVINNDIYATRLCHANVYWGAPAHQGDTMALERGKRTRIFNYQLFLEIYKFFRDNPNQTSIAAQPPTPNVLLGIGQPWGSDRQLDNNLVMISITHCLAEHLMEMLHRHRWEQQCPFDTDYLMIEEMDDDDKLALSKAKLAIVNMAKEQDAASAAATGGGEESGAVTKVTPMNLSALPVSQ